MTAPPPMHPLADGIAGFLFRHRRCLLGVIAVLCFLDVAAAALSYLVYPGYLDHGEPSVTLIAWRLLDGFAAYPTFDQPYRTSNVYGPYTYLFHSVVFFLAGPSVAVGKAASLIAAVLVPVVLFADHRRHGVASGAVAALLASGFLLLNIPVSIWNRPDVFVVLIVAVAVWAKNESKTGQPEWGWTAVIGVCGGLAVGLKLHAGIFVAPVALAHCMDKARGVKSLAVATAIGVAVALAPFAMPQFSLADLLSWFGPLLAAKPSALSNMTHHFRYAPLYLAPLILVVLSWMHGETKNRPVDAVYAGAFLACAVTAIYLGAKPGAGTYYFLALFPMAVDLGLDHGRRLPRPSLVWAGTGLFVAVIMAIGIPVQKRYYRALHWQEAGQVAAEIGAIMAAYPGRTIEMGVGHDVANYRSTYQKTRLVLAGHPYTFDSATVMETSMLKVPLSDDTLAMIRGCSTDIWLVPKGEQPFRMGNYYGGPIFSPRFIDAFQGSYAKERSFEYFDVWACVR